MQQLLRHVCLVIKKEKRLSSNFEKLCADKDMPVL